MKTHENDSRVHYLIYQTTNLITGKIYIGQHVTRNPDDNYLGSGTVLQIAIKKHGRQNFAKQILFDFETFEEMNEKERELVNEEFIAREDTYNAALGGTGGGILICNQKGLNNSVGQCYKTREKIQSDPEYRKRFGEAISKGQRLARERHPWKMCQKGSLNHMFGKHHSEQSKRLMSEIQKKVNHMIGKMWICNDATGENMTIRKSDVIPDGWRKGRICK